MKYPATNQVGKLAPCTLPVAGLNRQSSGDDRLRLQGVLLNPIIPNSPPHLTTNLFGVNNV